MSAPPPNSRDELRWRLSFLVCALASAIPLLVTYRLPMADLPQHAVQISVWKHLDDACYRFRDLYEINWLTPYLLGTIVLRAAAAALPVSAALKLVTYLSILALPLLMRRLAAFSGLDPWIALLGFPIAFGFSFYWGFINFSIAVPFALLQVLLVCRRSPALKIMALSILLAAAHALVYGFTLVICAPVLVLRREWRSLIALAAPAVPLAIWMARTSASESRARAPWDWNLTVLRPIELVAHQLSPGGDGDAFWFGVVVLIAAALVGLRPTKTLWRWAPFAAAAAAFLLGPLSAFGQTFLYPRLAPFVAATALIALDPGRARIRPAVARTVIVAVVLTWMAVLSGRFASFHRDADGFDRLVDEMPSNQRVLLLNVMQSDDVPGMPFLHFSGYYLERKGGVIGWSFASNFPPVLRYKRGVSVGVPPIVTHSPQYFDWNRHSHFDYFIVRAPGDMTALVFRGAEGHAELLGRSGYWWLYRNRSRSQRALCSPLEPDRAHASLSGRW